MQKKPWKIQGFESLFSRSLQDDKGREVVAITTGKFIARPTSERIAFVAAFFGN